MTAEEILIKSIIKIPKKLRPKKIQITEDYLENLKNKLSDTYDEYQKTNSRITICGVKVEVVETAIVPIFVY